MALHFDKDYSCYSCLLFVSLDFRCVYILQEIVLFRNTRELSLLL